MTYSSEGLNLQSVINACCITHCQVANMCKFIQQVMRMRNGGVSINDIFREITKEHVQDKQEEFDALHEMIYEEPCRLYDLSKFNRSRFWIQKNVDEIMALLPDCDDMQLKLNILPEVEKEMIPTLNDYITIKRESRKENIR